MIPSSYEEAGCAHAPRSPKMLPAQKPTKQMVQIHMLRAGDSSCAALFCEARLLAAGVDEEHMKILEDWYDKLSKKYPTVGHLDSNDRMK